MISLHFVAAVCKQDNIKMRKFKCSFHRLMHEFCQKIMFAYLI